MSFATNSPNPSIVQTLPGMDPGLVGGNPVDAGNNSIDPSAGITNDIPDVVLDYPGVQAYGVDASISSLMRDNPGLTYDEYMRIMAQHSDEWAEKLIDYYADLDQWNKTNEYNASREDTAYQRLVEDLRKAGLNPAMMYGSSASTSTSSASPVSLAGGATSRGVTSYSKMKSLLLTMIALEWQIQHQKTQDTFTGINTVLKALIPILGLFG